MKTPDKSRIIQVSGTEIEEISHHVWLQYILGKNGRWNLHVILDDNTSAIELRQHWGKIDYEREKLKEYQGSNPDLFSIALSQHLNLQKEKLSYKNISQDLNFDALVYILCANDMKRDDTSRNAGIICFRNLLLTLSMKEEINDWEKQGRDNIRENLIPWGVDDGPVNRDRVISSVKQVRKNIRTKKIIIKSDINLKYLYRIWFWLRQGKYLFQAEEMLKQQKPKDYEEYNARLKKRDIELLLYVANSGLNIP